MPDLKILLVGKSPGVGGAAIASARLMESLKDRGVEVRMLVQDGADESLGIYATTGGRVKRWINFLRFIIERLVFLPYERSSSIRFLSPWPIPEKV